MRVQHLFWNFFDHKNIMQRSARYAILTINGSLLTISVSLPQFRHLSIEVGIPLYSLMDWCLLLIVCYGLKCKIDKLQQNIDYKKRINTYFLHKKAKIYVM